MLQMFNRRTLGLPLHNKIYKLKSVSVLHRNKLRLKTICWVLKLFKTINDNTKKKRSKTTKKRTTEEEDEQQKKEKEKELLK